jgi:hypothetical protein
VSLRTCVFSDCYTTDNTFDVGLLLRQLLLFDRVILRSRRLSEIAELVRLFGVDAVSRLLNEGDLRLECVAHVAGSEGGAHRAPFTYVFKILRAQRQRELETPFIEAVVKRTNAGRYQTKKLVGALTGRALLPQRPEAFGLKALEAMTRDIAHNSPAFRVAALAETSRVVGALVRDRDLRFSIVQDEGASCRVDHNLLNIGLDEATAHKTIERALLAVMATNYRLEEMEFHAASIVFPEREIALLEEKFRFLLRGVSAATDDRRLMRVLSVTDLPDLGTAAHAGSLKLDRFIDIRRSNECVEFRHFLSTVDDLDDEQLHARVTSMSAKIGNAVQSTVGKAVRSALAIGAGFVPGAGPVMGPVASVLDTFLVDKLARRSGVVAFLDDMLRSVFDELV